MANIQKMAGGERLDKFGDFALIDNLVKTYQGVYSHDDIFNLEVVLVQNMILLNKELSFMDAKIRELQNQLKNS